MGWVEFGRGEGWSEVYSPFLDSYPLIHRKIIG